MDPYAKPGEQKVGENKPRIQHLAPDAAREMTRSQRESEKRQVAAARRSIKKSARRHLKKQMEADLDNMSP